VENKADLARLLAETIINKSRDLSKEIKLVTGEGFADSIVAK